MVDNHLKAHYTSRCNLLQALLYFCNGGSWLAYGNALQALSSCRPMTCLDPGNMLLATGLGEASRLIDNVALKRWSRLNPQPSWRCGLCPMTGPGLPSVPEAGGKVQPVPKGTRAASNTQPYVWHSVWASCPLLWVGYPPIGPTIPSDTSIEAIVLSYLSISICMFWMGHLCFA